MELQPKNYIKELELIILIAGDDILFTHISNRRPQAQKYILIDHQNTQIDIKYHMLFDEIIKHDFSQDINCLADLIRKYMKDPKKTRIIQVADASQKCVMQLQNILGIPGRSDEVVNSFLDKDISKQILKKSGVRVPKYYCPEIEHCKKNIQNEIEYLEKNIGYPMYAKPTQLYTSVANFKIENRDQLKEAINYYVDKEYNFEVDEFLQGTLYETDSVIFNNQIVFFVAWKNNLDFIKMYDGKTMGQIMQTPDSTIYQRLFKYTQDVIKAYGDVPDDVLDIEVWLTPNDELVLQELQLRRPGNKVGVTIQETIGLSLELVSHEFQTNNIVRIPKDDFTTRWKQYGAWVEYNLKGPLKIKGCNSIPKEVKSRLSTTWQKNEGFELKEGEFILKVVHMILINPNYEQLQKDWKILCDWKPYIFY